MKLTNNQIYTYATALAAAFQDSAQRFPIKANFYLQKNKSTLIALAQGIEESRMEIIRTYGEPIEDGAQYSIPQDKIKDAQKELSELLDLEQEVEIYKISADSLTDDISLTTGQMEALMFMID
jgi:hypothetical protein